MRITQTKAALFCNKMNVGIVIAIGSILLSMSTPIFAYDEPDNFAGVKFSEDVTLNYQIVARVQLTTTNCRVGKN